MKILYSPGFSGHCLQWPVLWPWLPKPNQPIYKPKYICDQYWVKISSMGCEIWCSQGFRVIACCDLDIGPFDLISMSQALIYTSFNFGEISSNIYGAIVFPLFSGHCRCKQISEVGKTRCAAAKVRGSGTPSIYPSHLKICQKWHTFLMGT